MSKLLFTLAGVGLFAMLLVNAVLMASGHFALGIVFFCGTSIYGFMLCRTFTLEHLKEEQ